MPVELAVAVAAHGELAQTVLKDAAFTRLEIVGRFDLAGQQIAGKVLHRREVLIDVLRKGCGRRPVRGVYGFPRVRYFHDQITDQQSGQCAVRHALSGVAGGDEDVAVAGTATHASHKA